MRILLLFILLCFGFVQKDKPDWRLYPNPVSISRDSYFTVEVKEGTLPAYLRVIDMNGKVVLCKYIGREKMFARIEITFRPGSYVVYLSDK